MLVIADVVVNVEAVDRVQEGPVGQKNTPAIPFAGFIVVHAS
jgi:hypothetical protein